MEGQVIGARETALAVNTFERFGAGVFPIVARQLVTAGESPLATLPWTLVRLFTLRKIKLKSIKIIITFITVDVH